MAGESIDGPSEVTPSRPPASQGLTRRIGDGWRSVSQFLSWILVRPSAERRGHVTTYLALRRSGEFDADFYRSRYPDVARARVNPLMHYVEQGAWEGRDPNSVFSTSGYLAANPDAQRERKNALLHWLRAGRSPVASSGLTSPGRETAATGGDVRRYREFVAGAIPTGGVTLVASNGEPELLSVPGLRARTFPDIDAMETPGRIGSTAAVAQLEWMRARGAEYLVLPEMTRAWWARLPEFQRHINRHYTRAASGEHGVIAQLDSRRNGTRPWQSRVEALLQEYGARFREPPSILDLTAGGLDLPSSFPDLTVVSKLDRDFPLAYLDESIDLVIVGGSGHGGRREEGRRIARNALIDLDERTDRGGAAIHWMSEAERTLPTISVLVPSYNGAAFLETCLRGLAETIPDHLETEVVVVDDGSTDSTSELLEGWARRDDRIRHLRQEDNLGFVESCNRAVAQSEGEALVFLNNDTVPVNGWIQPLIEMLIDRPDAGAVGGMLLYPDGTLQEAGGVIFSDGSAANFGRGDDPDDPLYRFVRPVDYCSGALLATRRTLFQELGGFDTAYHPCYYEDADYCFRLRADGLNTYYQPRSAVIHIEGGTAGTDLSQGPKRFQVEHRETFRQRWADQLEEQASPPSGFDGAVWAQLARRRRVGTGR